MDPPPPHAPPLPVGHEDPFLKNYHPSDLKIASEFLNTWLPFLSRDLCRRCSHLLSLRIHSLLGESNDSVEPLNSASNLNNSETCCIDHRDNSDAHSLGSWKDDNADGAETNSLGSWKDGVNGRTKPSRDASTSKLSTESPTINMTTGPRMSWADMAQEDDELEEEEETMTNMQVPNRSNYVNEVGLSKMKPELTREQREHIRFMKVTRKKDFICLERVKGRIVNILDGLELHTGIFSAVEQKRIVDYVYLLQEMGKNGKLKERTYTEPQKWMRGKGRVTIQFGCCYNYATDKQGNPPGILPDALVDPLPHLFKVIIRRLIGWHVLPPTCVPDSCIVNIYEEGDCIPPHIDNHDFVRPFCTVSFLSECDILFGSTLKVVGAGDFAGSTAISLPVGSVLVLNGNGADVAKHCVPAVPTKRISITFRRMNESKRPDKYVPEPDLQDLKPLAYNTEPPVSTTPAPLPPAHDVEQPASINPRARRKNMQFGKRDGKMEEKRGSTERGEYHSELHSLHRGNRQVPQNKRNGRSFGDSGILHYI